MKPGKIEILTSQWAERPSIHVTCAPHVAIKLRRLFGGIQRTSAHHASNFELAAIPAHAFELDWFRQMYPLEIATESRRAWDKLIRAEKKKRKQLAEVLDEGYVPGEFEVAVAPRHYQKVAADLLYHTRNLLITDELGTGKTFTMILLLVMRGTLPGVVVVPNHLQRQWESELKKFVPQLAVHRLRKGKPYKFAGMRERVLDPDTGEHTLRSVPAHPDVIVMNYEKLDGWAETLAAYAKTVLFDEAQELRHSGTDKYDAAKTLAAACEWRGSATATPVYNYGGEIHNVLSVVAPDSLGTRQEFLAEWCSGRSDNADDAKKVCVKDPVALGTYLREAGLMIRRTRQEVGRELPPLTIVRHVVECNMTRIHEAMTSVTELAQRMIQRIGTGIERMQWATEIDYRMRVATGMAKAPAVAEFVRLLLESEDRVLVFGWHHVVYDLLEEILARAGVLLVRYTGEESANQKAESVRKFIDGEVPVMLMSNRAGAGVNGLQDVCSTVVHAELDWSPKVHEQQDGRLHRDGQKRQVTSFYLVAEEGSDPVIADVLGLKEAQSRGIVTPDQMGEPILIGSSEDHIQRLAHAIVRRASTRSESTPSPSTIGEEKAQHG